MNSFLSRVNRGLARRWKRLGQNHRLATLARRLASLAPGAAQSTGQRPVIFFNASTRLSGLSLNAGFSLIASWALRLRGVPVVYFVCQQGMPLCVLGTRREDPSQPPPCTECVAQSQQTYTDGDVRWFGYTADPALECLIEAMPLAELERFTYQGMPLGRLVLPSVRWILRRHHLVDDEPTRLLYRRYLLSARSVAGQFRQLVETVRPQAVVVFNGMFYPEATARWVARQQEPPVRVISHEVGLRPFSGFFTDGDATAYPIDLPDSFQLDECQNAMLNEYLSQRFKGNFSMAGVRFWPEMTPVDPAFWERAARFKQLVPVFTNVIFDTSQDFANVVFEDMFDWLDAVKEVMTRHPETLFVIRAHPDETRPGKTSLETVANWMRQSGVDQLPNVEFFAPDAYFSSYEIISRSRFVMIYNSTIGLEAALMGAPVLTAGKSRFTQLPVVFFPQTRQAYLEQLEAFLGAEEIEVPIEFPHNARRFLYAQVFRSSLPFDRFLEEDGVWKGYVAVKPGALQEIQSGESETIRVILKGILEGGNFLLDT